jgi:small subunit ribosomal protein S17
METESAASAPGSSRLHRQELTGVVTSAKMEKTIVVKVTRLVRHKLYTRVMRVNKKFYAHDEKREARLGDRVTIVETRPLSKLKRWRLTQVLTRSTRVDHSSKREQGQLS